MVHLHREVHPFLVVHLEVVRLRLEVHQHPCLGALDLLAWEVHRHLEVRLGVGVHREAVHLEEVHLHPSQGEALVAHLLPPS